MNLTIFLTNHNLFILRLVLSLLGALIAHSFRHTGHDYWLLMMLLFSLIALAPSYYQVKKNKSHRKLFFDQVMHWAGGLFAATVVYAYHASGRIYHEEAGLIVLLMLALTTYLDGIKSGWRSCFIGVFLGLTAICIAYFDDYIWQLSIFAAIAAIVSHFFNAGLSLSDQSSHKFL